MERRHFLTGLISGGIVGGTAGALGYRYATAPAEEKPPALMPGPDTAKKLVPTSLTHQEALQKLIAGNNRFVENTLVHPHESRDWRTEVAKEQHPFAVILGCSDSRVPPEILFDEGLGDLFVVRLAGHVADDDGLGTIEYAVEHLHVPLVVVLGHQNCGAVQAAVGAIVNNVEVQGHMVRLVDDIAPCVEEVQHQPGDLIDNAVRANIRYVAHKLRRSHPIMHPLVESDKVKVVGAYYNLETGVVEWLPTEKS